MSDDEARPVLTNPPVEPKQIPKSAAESAGEEGSGGELELFHALSRDRGFYPVQHAVSLILRAPWIWIVLLATSFGYHWLAGILVDLGWVARTVVFPTLGTPVSQAFHAGLIVLAAGAAVDALRSSKKPRLLATLRRWTGRALGGAAAYLLLRLGFDLTGLRELLGPARYFWPTDLGGIFLALWLWLHVAAELTLLDRGPLTALPRGVGRALWRVTRLPVAIASGEGRARLAAGLSPISLYVLIGSLTYGLSMLFGLGVGPGLVAVCGMSFASAVHILAWTHIELASRLREGDLSREELPLDEDTPRLPGPEDP